MALKRINKERVRAALAALPPNRLSRASKFAEAAMQAFINIASYNNSDADTDAAAEYFNTACNKLRAAKRIERVRAKLNTMLVAESELKNG